MDDIEEIIENELEAKSIEKDVTLDIVDAKATDDNPKKTKKIRSQAQIEAFEKARIKRAENYQKRQLLKQQQHQEKKEIKTQIQEKVNSLSTEEIKEELKKPVKKSVQDTPPQHSYGHYNHQGPTPIINNYYYNTPQPPPEVKKKGRKKKVVYVSDSESDDEELPKPILKQAVAPAPAPAPVPAPQKRAVKKPGFSFNFI